MLKPLVEKGLALENSLLFSLLDRQEGRNVLRDVGCAKRRFLFLHSVSRLRGQRRTISIELKDKSIALGH